MMSKGVANLMVGETRQVLRYVAISAAFFVIFAVQIAKANEGRDLVVRQASHQGFCGARTAKDYLRPLAMMAPIHHVPTSGKLPFAPAGLTLEPRGGALAVGGGPVGFGFSDDAIGQVRHLNWNVLAQLHEVNARGALVTILGAKRRRIGSMQGDKIKDLLFQLPARPAFYRVDILFRHIRTGHVLGEFSNYVRVVRPRFDAGLITSLSVVHWGEVVSTRLANFGTETISSISPDWGFAVQRFDGQEWVPAASNPAPKKQKPLVQKLTAGQMDDCVHFRVSSSEEPGRYRFSMVVSRSQSAGPEGRAVPVNAEFEVDGRVLK